MENKELQFSKKIHADRIRLLQTIFEKIEHPEVAELFERTRDYIDETDPILKRILDKEIKSRLL